VEDSEVLVKQTAIRGLTSVMFDLVKAGLPGSTHQTVCQMLQPKSDGAKDGAAYGPTSDSVGAITSSG
jgi:hypothetical protein